MIGALIFVLSIALEDPAYEDIEIETISGDSISSEDHRSSYGEMPVEIWNRGHITAALSFRALRYVLLRHFADSPQ